MRLRPWILLATAMALAGCGEVKKQAFAECLGEAPSEGQIVRAVSIVACMQTKGYSGWCATNSLCFNANRLDTKLAENIF